MLRTSHFSTPISNRPEEMKQERARRFQTLEQEVARLKAETEKAKKDGMCWVGEAVGWW